MCLPERASRLKFLGASISAYDASLIFRYFGTFEARVAVEPWMGSRWTEPWPRTDWVGARALAQRKKKYETGQQFPKRVGLKATIHRRDLSKTSASLNPMNARITRHGTSKSSSRACARASSIAFRIRCSSKSSALCNGSRLGRLNPSSVIEYHIDIRARMSLCTIA